MIGKVLTFYLRDELFGIDITAVKEINRNIEYTPVPDANPNIVGLLNMRGQIVTLFNLLKMMGQDHTNKDEKPVCIILKKKANTPDHVGFLIDKPGDVVDVDDEICERPPANIGSIEGKFLREIVKLKDRLIMIVDPEKIFA